MSTDAWCAVDKYVVVAKGQKSIKGFVGIVTEDRRDKPRGYARKGMVQIEYSAPTVERQVKRGWYYPSTLIDGSAHEQAYKDAQEAGKLYRLKEEGEESDESGEASSDSEVQPATIPRPRGKAPRGKRWDGVAGEWVEKSEDDTSNNGSHPAPAPATAPRRSSRRETGGGQIFSALMRRNGGALPEVEADETGSRYRGDPVSDETGKMRDIVGRIRHNQPPGGDGVRLHSGLQGEHAIAVFTIAAPGMIATARNVIKQIGADATDADLAEFVVSYLEENCLKLDGSGYLEQDELANLKRLIRAAARKPDSDIPLVRCKNVNGDCAGCAALEAARGTAMFDVVRRRPVNACRQKIQPQNDSTRQSRTWQRIADESCAHLRGEILALDEGSPQEEKWIRDRARVAVNRRQEQGRIFGALVNWRPGLAAARRENARNMFTERAKGVIHNNDVLHLAARWELNYFAISDDVPYMHEI